MLLLMFLLPLFSFPDYSLTEITLSELGAQLVPNAWIINLAFIILASGSLLAGWRHYEGFILHRVLLVLFGLSLSLSAFYNHTPSTPDLLYKVMEGWWHIYFLSTAALSFILLSLATSFIVESRNERLAAIVVGLSILFLSFMMSEHESLAGVWQRLIFIISFGWLIYNFRTKNG